MNISKPYFLLMPKLVPGFFVTLMTLLAPIYLAANESAGSPSTRQSLSSPDPSAEQRRVMKNQFEAIFRNLDTQLLGPYRQESWQPPEDLLVSVSGLFGHFEKKLMGCAKEFCKYQFSFESENIAEQFAAELSIEGSILLRQQEKKESLSLIVYFFPPEADLSRLK